MASITMDRAWLTLAADPAQSVQLLYTDPRMHMTEKEGAVTALAGGRRRAVTKAGVGRSLSLAVGPSTPDLATLNGWIGSTVLYRNGLGERWWAIYLGIAWQPSADGRFRQLTVQLLEVTVNEAV